MIIDLQCISISHQGDPFVVASTTRPPTPYQQNFNYPQDIILIALLRAPNRRRTECLSKLPSYDYRLTGKVSGRMAAN